MKNTYNHLFKGLISWILLTLPLFTFGQSEILPLWPDEIPNFQPATEKEVQTQGDIFWIRKVQKPSLAVYLPSKANANGKAILICPGGGYEGLAYDWEGSDIAKLLNSKGIAAFVLKYRMPQAKSVAVSHLAPLQDAQRALRLIREHSEKWNLSPNQIGVMGFSAGGHLAATLATHYQQESFAPMDEIDRRNARPDFSILVYPVISMKAEHTHQGSKDNLLGKSPLDSLVSLYSNELQVTKNTPPTFLIHSADDKAVPVSNSLLFYKALQKFEVQSELHIYSYGGHGYGLALGKGHLQGWTERMEDWLNSF